MRRALGGNGLDGNVQTLQTMQTLMGNEERRVQPTDHPTDDDAPG